MNINVTAYLNQLGYGVVGLNLVKALARAGTDVALWVNGPGEVPAEDRGLVEAAVARTASYDPHAPSLRVAHQWDMAHRVGSGTHAGLTFFELDRLTPAEVHHLSCLDRVFVPSRWAAGVARDSGVPASVLCVAPLGVDPHVFHPGVTPGLLADGDDASRRLLADGTTVFLSCGKWEVRKGHDRLVEAFDSAFRPDDDVLLVMNCSNPFLGEADRRAWDDLYAHSRMGRAGKVRVLPARLPRQQDVARLMALADCGVFPARAEGWNLELLEMMALGKHVVATDYAAHTEFCTAANALLVKVDALEPAFDGVFFRTGFGNWAELGDAQAVQLSSHMRHVHDLKRKGGLGRNDAGLETARSLTWDRTAKEVLCGLVT